MRYTEIVESSSRYEKCLVWQSEEDAAQIKGKALRRDGIDIVVDWNVMYFNDKFEFDHIDYHYRMKIPPGKRPEIKLISELTTADMHKTA